MRTDPGAMPGGRQRQAMKASVDDSYRLLAAKYVRGQAKQLAAQLDGARRGEDIEYIHRARVASRRLQAALRMFLDCFEAKTLKRWRKATRRLTKGLGEARDKDVQIQYLCGVLCNLKEDACYSGIARLLVKIERKRELLHSKVNRALDRLQASRVLEEMRRVTGEVLAGAKAREVGIKSPLVFGQTEQHILGSLGRMLPYHDSLEDPEDHKRHHEMRIAAKRLRYTMEIAKPVYNGRLDQTIVAAKKMQTLLLQR